MNWDRVQGNWKQFEGRVKQKWGQLTDDDLTRIAGNREQLEGKIQSRYGHAKDRSKRKSMTGSTSYNASRFNGAARRLGPRYFLEPSCLRHRVELAVQLRELVLVAEHLSS